MMTALIEAHSLFQQGIYQPCWQDLGPLRLHWHPEIPDADWNHARPRPGEPWPTDPQPLLTALKARCAALERPPVVVVASPETGPADPWETYLRQRGWQPCFEHRWMLWSAEEGETEREEEASCRIARVSGGEDLAAFLEVFVEGFGLTAAEVAPWRRALERSAEERFPGFEIRHYLARVEGRPAGIATLCRTLVDGPGFDAGIAGFYNLAVHPAFRRRGIGSALQRRRRRAARAAGIRRGFLQTESTAVAEWDRRQGFTPGPRVVGLGPPAVAIPPPG